ncbi:hypothetical protein CWI36_0107p0020 [Hamiltosporidium magnivora]|uniref:Leucine-rich repeat-containing protein n=2 Tax=Hamiltosporidium magnivora TaxID=148818 RepID=A0A4V2JWP1_9MICR|nr:hypothetical protein CWI36_0107p0020 [Hamiltosporidium magnivora]
MNNFTTRYKKRFSGNTFVNNSVLFGYILCLLDTIASYKYVYRFEQYENSKIIFLDMKRQPETYLGANNEDFKLDLLNSEPILDEKNTKIFAYEKDHFINFESLNNILNLSISDRPNGKIECNFDLLYFLKSTKDITEIPDEVNHIDIKTILIGFKYLKAINNKNMSKFIQALIFKIFLTPNKSFLKKNCTYIQGLMDLNFWSKMDFYITKSFISGLLNIWMINNIFRDGNLILIKNTRRYYDFVYFDKHIPYKNISIDSSRDIFGEKKLRGLVFYNVEIFETALFLDRYIDSIEKLEYISFVNIKINSIWWCKLFCKVNLSTLILSFNSIASEQSFFDGFSKVSIVQYTLHLEISFYSLKIPKEFCDSLFYFKFLRILKLQNYEMNEKTEYYFLRAIENLNDLEELTIQQSHLSTKFNDILLKKQRLKTLHIENDFSEKRNLEIVLWDSYKILKQICLHNMNIGEKCLIEIFNLESLEATNIVIIDKLDILSKLDFLEKFELSYCENNLGFLTKLSSMCNIRLNIMSLLHCNLILNDLNIIKNFEVLEDLNLTGCKFSNFGFF